MQVNNFSNTQVINRKLNPPSSIKVLLSDYGKVKAYESSKKLYIVAFINAFITSILLVALICLAIVFLAVSASSFDITSNRFITTLIVSTIVLAQGIYNLAFFLLGISVKNKRSILKSKLSFDNQCSNTLLRGASIALIILFTIPTLVQDPLIPITSTELLNLSYLNEISISIITLLSILFFVHIDMIIVVYVFKKKIVTKKLQELALKVISTPDNAIPEKITKSYIDQVIFENIEGKT